LHARGYSKMTKRARASSDSGVPKAKHRIGYDPSWKTTFPWHVTVEEESDLGSSSTSALSVTGLLCSLYRRHHIRQQNGAGTWTDKPCTYLHKDMLERHENSEMLVKALEREALRLSSSAMEVFGRPLAKGYLFI